MTAEQNPLPTPRLLTIMGSGETSPTMARTHRELLARLGPPPVPAVLLDTPVGFQENAAQIAQKAREYFRVSVGADVEVATWRSAEESGVLEYEQMLVRLREARYVFAGPGSPSYALRQWAPTEVPAVLAEKLRRGGGVTFASAAALTLGVATVPVYEIYKVGAELAWLEGLDLLAELGLKAAVIPHYDNAEGGNHDTRYCYLGERRLTLLEQRLPPGAFVLGVDEHTAAVFDLDADTFTVVGRGGMTVRRAGRSDVFPSGTVGAIDELRGAGKDASGPPGPAGRPPAVAAPPVVPATAPLAETIVRLQADFDEAITRRDVAAAVTAVLELDGELIAWMADTLQSDDLDRGRAALRGMIVRLGELATTGAREPSEVVGPFVDALVGMRDAARADRRWAEADEVRDRLVALGVEVRDTPDGTAWRLERPPTGGAGVG